MGQLSIAIVNYQRVMGIINQLITGGSHLVGNGWMLDGD